VGVAYTARVSPQRIQEVDRQVMTREIDDAFDLNADGRLCEPDVAAEPVGRFHAWWRGDLLPDLVPLAGLGTEPINDERRVAKVAALNRREIQRRGREGNHFWLARIWDEPVGWGWIASDEVSIGELGITRRLPPGNRYLWDFVTVPSWRGRGIYPWLLQTIVARETDGERFWVGHDLPNVASARGIAKAGFGEVGILFRDPDGRYELIPTGPLERAAVASDLFGVPLAGHLSARTV
jgi:GNAT superfamily N-acetyltransferase